MPASVPDSTRARAQAGGGAIPAPVAARRAPWSWLRNDNFWAIAVLSPSLVAVAIFIYAFILWTIYISLVGWNDIVPNYEFVGLRNFQRLSQNPRYLIDLANTAKFTVLFMAQCIGFGFLLAVLLDQRIKGESIFRTIYIFPFAISAIVTGVAWRWLMYPNSGINLLFDSVGLGILKNSWFADPNIGIMAVSIPAAWQMTGYTMALYLAGLRGISQELREAAKIDGASGWQFYRYIAVPLVTPVTLTVFVILGVISLRLFDLTAAMTSSGPAFADDTPAFFMFQATFQKNNFSQGASIAVTMLILAAGLIIPYLRSIHLEAQR